MKRWKQWVLLACLVSMLGHQVSANAVLAPVENYVVNRAVGGIIANRIAAAQGVAANDAAWLATAANDPIYKATMAGISSQMTAVNVASTVAGGALAFAGAPLWLTIAAGLGITALGAYYFSSDGLQKVTINQTDTLVSIQAQSTPVKPAYSAPSVPSTPEPTYGQLALTAGLIVYKGICAYGGDCLSYPAAPADYSKSAPFLSAGGDYIVIAYSLTEITRLEAAYASQLSREGVWNWADGSKVVKSFSSAYFLPRSGGGYDLYGSYIVTRTPPAVVDANGNTQLQPAVTTYETKQLTGWTVGATAPIPQTFTNITDAYPAITDAQKAVPMPDAQLARLADEAWKRAAQAPEYEGLPYSAADPVTSSDVADWKAGHPGAMPTLGDLLRPAANPANDTNGVPISPSVQPGSIPGTNTGTNPSTSTSGRPDLGEDPNVPDPTLEEVPDADTILQPLLSLFPELRSFQTPDHAAQCPRPQFDVFGKSIVMDAQCEIAEQYRGELAATMLVVWLLVGLFIILSA